MLFSTPRLTVRCMRAADAAVVAAYRNDPVINHFQDWDLPYSEATFLERLAANPEFDTIPEGRWVNLALELDEPGGPVLVGDLACHLHDGGHVAELGYTLRGQYQGKGFASEAAGALVDHLLATTDVHRFEASLDEENVASMRVLEAIGMTFESFSRQSYPIRGSWEDDTRYAMLRDDRAAWLARPDTPPSDVQLAEITPDDAYLWGRLRTHHSQERFVSPMALSFRDALFPEVIDGAPVVPWLRGVVADGERVAFVMLAEVTEHHPEPYLWRLLVDRMHQRRGIGTTVVHQLCQQLADQGHRTLTTSWGEGTGSPRRFYERLGFVPTGRIVEGETEARLRW
ncbi:MAG: N-acetyltransferase [Actinobacteria bacterium]|nr:N-acetyltransferase [Actinomycetota bacterium]